MTLDRRYWLWDMLLLLALAGLLRLHGLGALSFYYDEAENALVARTYLQTGHFELPSGKSEPNGLLYKWLTAEMFRFFGESEWSARVPAALFGILTTLWIYLWSSHWFGSWTGRAAGFLFAVWPWTVTWGRIGRFYGLQQFLFVLMVVSAWKILECNCLGHPMAEPPKVSGRKPGLALRLLRLAPLAGWIALSLLASATTVLAVSFLPAYLLMRLAWCWRRGKSQDCEFGRSLRYFLSGAAASVATLTLLWVLNPDAVYAGFGLLKLPYSPGYYALFLRENFGLAFLALALAGTVMAWRKGRPGWMVLCAAWAPILVHSLLVPHYRDRFIYHAFAFVLILAALPLGWALEALKDFFNVRLSLRARPTWRDALAVAVLAVAAQSVIQNVLLAECGTAAVVRGSRKTLAREVADWRGLAAIFNADPGVQTKEGARTEASGSRSRSTLVSADAIPTAYYLRLPDFMYPDVDPKGMEFHPHTATPILKDATAMNRILDSTGEVWVVGTRRKFEAASRSASGARLWNRLMEESSEIWQGQHEVLFHRRR
ncbi:MAG: hypothetical protein GHCLOJNM_01710 [bacterium]|nr:hypothetical protein [bacterium]